MSKEVLRLPAGQRLTLVTDVHLGDGSYTDLFGKNDGEFLTLLTHAERTSEKVSVMGDCFDLLQAHSLPHIFRAHREVVARLAGLARESRLVFLRGNHDFMADVARAFPRSKVCDRLRIGADVRVEHGDAYDAWGNREMATAGRFHNFLERLTRSFWRVPLHEYKDWGNRFLHWSGHKLFVALRLLRWSFRRVGWKRRARRLQRFLSYWSRTVWGDAHGIFRRVRKELARSTDTRVLLLGHTHLPGDVRLGEKRYVNVGSWAAANTQYCEYDGNDFTLWDWRTRARIGDERYRWLLLHPEIPSFEEWYREVHREMLYFKV